MSLFIAIIFIAELIIVWTVVSNIIKADKYVCALNKKVTQCRPKIETGLSCFKDCVRCLRSTIESAQNFIECKKKEIRSRIIKALIVYALLIVMKTKFKKAAAACKFLVKAKDLWGALLG